MRSHAGDNLKASTYAQEQKGNANRYTAEEKVKSTVDDDTMRIGMVTRLHEMFELVGLDTNFNNHKNKTVIGSKRKNNVA